MRSSAAWFDATRSLASSASTASGATRPHRERAPLHVYPRATRHAGRRGHAGQPPTFRHRHPCQLLNARGRRGACGHHHCCDWWA